jgi:hypothetical protein
MPWIATIHCSWGGFISYITAVRNSPNTKKRESGRTACGGIGYLQYGVGASASTGAGVGGEDCLQQS